MADHPRPAPEPARRFRPRWLVAALVLSLGLNLAVAGLVAGLALHGPPRVARGETGVWSYAADLPAPHRRDLAREMRGGRGDWSSGPRARLRAHRAAMAAALTAEPFDPAAAEAVLRAERELVASLADRGAAALMTQIRRMDADARRAFATSLLRGGDRPRRDGPRDGDR